MITKKTRNAGCYAMALICSLATTFFNYSCSTDEYYNEGIQTPQNETSKTRALSSRMSTSGNSLIDSIASSDEFWEFEISTELLADKFSDYTSTFNEEEYDQLMVNLNDDDYMEEFIKKANLEKELQQMNEAKENLLLHTGFSRLSEDERMQLFMQYAESREQSKINPVKTRTEGGNTSKCEEQRQAAYEEAKADYDNAILKCKVESSPYSCKIYATAKYDRNKRIADKEYEECVQNKN